MGILVDGTWKTEAEYANGEGEFERQPSRFRAWVEDRKDADFPLEPDRYHLYVSYACPWAHRVLIVRALKGLQEVLPVTVVDPWMGDDGWFFSERLGCEPDPNLGAQYLRELYVAAEPMCSGRVTVPLLWDKRARRIVNNESRDLIKMLDRVFSRLATRPCVLWPESSDQAIGEMIDQNYGPVNNGVYRAGFASTQAAYEAAVQALFARLGECERSLGQRPFLCGEVATAADVCLFTTLLRFEPVYHYHFKCNLYPLRAFPRLWEFTRALYQVPEIRATCRLDHVKLHYFTSHKHINPTGIVPSGPVLDLDAPVQPRLSRPFAR